MAAKKKAAPAAKAGKRIVTALKVGDPVMVLCGGNKKKGKILKSQTGKVLRILPKRSRVVVEGLNIIKRHKKAMTSRDSAGILEKEGSVHISNVMYYREELKRPVRIKMKLLDDGRKVRGFINPQTKKFEQIDV
ncbi:MAG TPA: 50S ribosomal protein L24 [Oligoflexia bacterium]|nr:50S ribosomal protein L24 [Oligoflexia bacterium]